MYISYLNKNGKTYALEKNGKFSIIKTTNNIEKVLIVKNNIEEIKNLILNTNTNIKNKKIEFILNLFKLTPITLIGIILLLIPIPSLLNIFGISLIIGSSILLYKENKDYLERKNNYFNKIEILEKMLTTEKQKFHVLKKIAKEVKNPVDTKEKNIDTSKKIKQLYMKLELINFYCQNFSKLFLIYNTGGEELLIKNLKQNYNESEIEFIVFLIKNIDEQKNYKKEKIKTLL